MQNIETDCESKHESVKKMYIDFLDESFFALKSSFALAEKIFSLQRKFQHWFVMFSLGFCSAKILIKPDVLLA